MKQIYLNLEKKNMRTQKALRFDENVPDKYSLKFHVACKDVFVWSFYHQINTSFFLKKMFPCLFIEVRFEVSAFDIPKY